MTPDESKSEKDFAKALTAACVRRGEIEHLHSGITPVTLTGDYSDVFVVDANGRRIAWTEVSRIDQNEMRVLMIGVVDRIYTFLARTIFTGCRMSRFSRRLNARPFPGRSIGTNRSFSMIF
jgi:hypothetical protein